MAVFRRFVFAVIPLLALVPALTGCPNVRAVIRVSTTSLNFGEDREFIRIRIWKMESARDLAPIVIAASDAWIQVDTCDSPDDGCISRGPLDPVIVTVRADRSRMALGENKGVLSIGAEGAVSQFVDVSARTVVVADFRASTRTPVQDEEVTFTDASQTAPGWTLTSWFWDFGNNRVSGEQNPPAVRYRDPGSFVVTLSVTATDGTKTITQEARREGFIVVTPRVGPTASFTVSSKTPLVNNQVIFTDTSAAGSAPIESWAWEFGDASPIDRRQHPTHVYATGGPKTVKLTVVTAHGVSSFQDTLTVQVSPPTADFTADNTTPPLLIQEDGSSAAVVNFTDQSRAGSTPIASWFWTFGDAGVSTQQHPVHVYTETGPFTVTLRVTAQDGSTHTVEKANFINVQEVGPTANFTADDRRPLVGSVVQFTDLSVPGSAPITEWAWSFGDGGISAERNPRHPYLTAGSFDVRLRVIDAMYREDIIAMPGFIAVFEPSPLDIFIDAEDPAFMFDNLEDSAFRGPGFTAHVIDMTSQTWRTAAEVNAPRWDHWLTVIEPDTVRHTTALLFISGGVSGADAPRQVQPPGLGTLAVQTGSIIAILVQTPNQPLIFAGDQQTPRSEESLIAFSFDKFLDSFAGGGPDNAWPVLLPMTKAAVRAMDVVQMFMGDTRNKPVDSFVVAGLSSRGWTTWLAGAVDDRVRAIAPMTFDLLNFVPQLEHHLNVYGFFSEPWFDFVELDVFSRLDTPAGQALRRIVDPYEYRARFGPIPKLLISSTGDAFHVPDAAQFYIDDIPGETKVSYIPNTSNALDPAVFLPILAPWYAAILEDQSLPGLDWTVEADRIVAMPAPGTAPSEVRFWVATSSNRDFRFDPNLNQFDPPEWRPSVRLNPDGAGNFAAPLPRIPGQWTGVFLQLKYDTGVIFQGAAVPLTFSTEVRVRPGGAQEFPEQEFIGPVANFTVSNAAPRVNQAVQFTDTSSPGSGPILRWFWQFGDGGASMLQNPVHAYGTYGVFSPSLTVTTVHGMDIEVKDSLISVTQAK